MRYKKLIQELKKEYIVKIRRDIIEIEYKDRIFKIIKINELEIYFFSNISLLQPVEKILQKIKTKIQREMYIRNSKMHDIFIEVKCLEDKIDCEVYFNKGFIIILFDNFMVRLNSKGNFSLQELEYENGSRREEVLKKVATIKEELKKHFDTLSLVSILPPL